MILVLRILGNQALSASRIGNKSMVSKQSQWAPKHHDIWNLFKTVIFKTFSNHVHDALEFDDLKICTPPAFSGSRHEKNATPLAILSNDVKNRQPLSRDDFFFHAGCTRNAIFQIPVSNSRSRLYKKYFFLHHHAENPIKNNVF